MRNQGGILQNIDRWMVAIFLLLVGMGWLSIYAAVYNDEHQSILDLTQNYGKQAIWIGGAMLLALSILIIDGKFFAAFSYPIYILFMLLLLLEIGRAHV